MSQQVPSTTSVKNEVPRRDNNYRSMSLEKLSQILLHRGDSQTSLELAAERDAILDMLHLETVPNLRRAEERVRNWIMHSLCQSYQQHQVGGAPAASLITLAKSVCMAGWVDASTRLDFLADVLHDEDEIARCLSAEQIIAKKGAMLSAVALINIAETKGAAGFSLEAQKLVKYVLTNKWHNSKQDILSRTPEVSSGVSLLIAEHVLSVSTVRDCLDWLIPPHHVSIDSHRMECVKTFFVKVKGTLTAAQQWEWFEYVSRRWIMPSNNKSSVVISFKKCLDIMPTELRSTATLVREVLKPIKNRSISHAIALLRDMERWSCPLKLIKNPPKSISDVCEKILKVPTWEMDQTPLTTAEEFCAVAKQYASLVSAYFPQWAQRLLQTVEEQENVSTIERLLSDDTTWAAEVLEYYHLDDIERNRLNEILCTSDFMHRLISEHVITESHLKDPRNMMQKIQEKLDQDLGAAPVTTVLQQSPLVEGTVTYNGLTLKQLELYATELYPALCDVLPLFKQAKVLSPPRHGTCNVYAQLFWNGNTNELRNHGHPDNIPLDVLGNLCRRGVSLDPILVAKLRFLSRFFVAKILEETPKSKEFLSTLDVGNRLLRKFIVKYRPELSRLPDIMRRRQPKQLCFANKLIEGIEELKWLLTHETLDIDAVLNPVGVVWRPTVHRLDELTHLFFDDWTRHFDSIVEFIPIATKSVNSELQVVVETVNVRRMAVQLAYRDVFAEMLQNRERYRFSDSGRVINADDAERWFRSLSIMSPDTREHFIRGAKEFMHAISAARYAVSVFGRMLYRQRQLTLVPRENALYHEFIISRVQVQRKAERMVIIKELVECIRKASDMEREASERIQQARDTSSKMRLCLFNDVEYEQLLHCVSNIIHTTDAEKERCYAIVALRMNIDIAEAPQHLEGIFDSEIPPRTSTSTIVLSEKHVPIVLHDCSSAPFTWSKELLLLYWMEQKRLPTFSEVLIFNVVDFETLREECSFFLQKTSSPYDTDNGRRMRMMYSLVIACHDDAADITVVDTMMRQLVKEHEKKPLRHWLHIFFIRSAAVTHVRTTFPSLVELQSPTDREDVIATCCVDEFRQFLRSRIPVEMYYSKTEVRQGKSKAIKDRHPVTSLLILPSMSLFTPLQAMVVPSSPLKNSPQLTYWLELPSVPSQETVTGLFQYFFLGGLSRCSRVGSEVLLLQRESKYLIEVPYGVLEDLPAFALLPDANFLLRTAADNEYSLIMNQAHDFCRTEVSHGIQKCIRFLKQIVTTAIGGADALSDPLITAIVSTAIRVCSPDANPLIDEAAWEARHRICSPTTPSYFLSWYLLGEESSSRAYKLIIISDGATDPELNELQQSTDFIEVVDISRESITQDELRDAFIKGVGVLPTADTIRQSLGGFVVTRHTLMAAVRVSLAMHTQCCPVVMVGETGCGKTFLIQTLATVLTKKLITIDVKPCLVWHDKVQTLKDENLMYELDKQAAIIEAAAATAVVSGDELEEGSEIHSKRLSNAQKRVSAMSKATLKAILRHALATYKDKDVLIFFDELNNWHLQDVIKALVLDRRYDGVEIPDHWTIAGACNPFRRANDGTLVYAVQPRVHPSFRAFAWSFGRCHESEEQSIVGSMCADAKLDRASTEFLVNAIPGVHKLIRQHLPERIISFRDSRRCIRLSQELAPVVAALFDDDDDGASSSNSITPIQLSYLAFFVAYMVSIDSTTSLRSMMEGQFSECVDVVNKLKKKIFETFRVLDDKLLANGIIEETLLVVLLCVFTRTPLIIAGPPGTGKSLVLDLVTEAATHRLFSRLFKKLPTLVRYNFQCTAMTRPSAVNDIFTTANDLGASALALTAIEELHHLTTSPERPLRSFIRWIDHEGCAEPYLPAFVGTSNIVEMDRAIVNRCVCLFRQVPTVEALKTIIEQVNVSTLSRHSATIAQTVFDSAKETAATTQGQHVFGLRDLYALLRSVQQFANSTTDIDASDPTYEEVIHQLMLRCCGYDCLGVYNNDHQALRQTQMALLRDALQSPPTRPVMISSSSFSAVRAMLRLHLPVRDGAPPVFISGDILRRDPGMLSFHMQQVMACMQMGHTLILMDAPLVCEALMAVLADSVVQFGNRKLSRIAFDGECEYCEFDSRFRVILVNTTKTEVSRMVLDRFERHTLPVDNVTCGEMDSQSVSRGVVVKMLPTNLRFSLGKVLADPVMWQEVVYGSHKALLLDASDEGDQTNSKKKKRHVQRILRLIDVPAAVQLLRERFSMDMDGCLAMANAVYQSRQLRPLLIKERFVCAFLNIPASDVPTNEKELARKLFANCMESLDQPRDADEHVVAAQEPKLETFVVIGPYSRTNTSDGLLHLELEQNLSPHNAKAIIILQVESDPSMNDDEYAMKPQLLFIVCDLIQRLASDTARALLLLVPTIRENSGDVQRRLLPNVTLECHVDWCYVMLDTLHFESKLPNPFTREEFLKEIAATYPSEEASVLAKTLREWSPARISNSTILDLAKPFKKDAKLFADTLLDHRTKTNNVVAEFVSNKAQLYHGTSLRSFHALKRAYVALVDGVAWYFGIMSLHRTNLELLFGGADGTSYLPKDIDARVECLTSMLTHTQHTKTTNASSPKRFRANALCTQLFFGADIDQSDDAYGIYEAILKPMRERRIIKNTSDRVHIVASALMHRLWLLTGSLNYPLWLLEDSRVASLAEQLRLLHFICQLPMESTSNDDDLAITDYIENSGSRPLYEESRVFLLPLEDVAGCECAVVREMEKLAAPRWVRSVFTAFGGKHETKRSVFDLSTQLIETASNPPQWPAEVQSSCAMWLEYAILLARHFPDRILDIDPSQASASLSTVSGAEPCYTPDVFVILKKIAKAENELRGKNESILLQEFKSQTLQSREAKRDNSVWSRLLDIIEEYSVGQKEGCNDPADMIKSLSLCLFCLHSFLQGSFTRYTLREVLTWSDAPNLARASCPIHFDDKDSLYRVVWPQIVIRLRSSVRVYNELCKKVFLQILQPSQTSAKDLPHAHGAGTLKCFSSADQFPQETALPCSEDNLNVLSLAPWTPMLRLADLVRAAWVASTALHMRWSGMDIADMVTLSVCRDISLGVKMLRVIFDADADKVLQPLPCALGSLNIMPHEPQFGGILQDEISPLSAILLQHPVGPCLDAVTKLLHTTPDLVHEIAAHVQEVKADCENEFHQTEDEVTAIVAFTANTESFFGREEDNLYYRIHQVLRNNEVVDTQTVSHELRVWCTHLVNGLRKIPGEHRVIYRGIKKRGVDAYKGRKPQERIILNEFTASSSNPTVCLEFAEHDGIVLVIESINARSIQRYSLFPREDEYILIPGTEVEVQCNVPSRTLNGVAQFQHINVNFTNAFVFFKEVVDLRGRLDSQTVRYE